MRMRPEMLLIVGGIQADTYADTYGGHVVRRDAQPVDMVLHSFSWTETIYLLVFIVLCSLFVPLFLGYKIPAYFQ
jgi:hypothetical protein